MLRFAYPLLIVAALFAYWKFFSSVGPDLRRQRWRWMGYGVGIGLTIWLAVRGGGLRGAALGLLVLLALRALPYVVQWRNGRSSNAEGDELPHPGQRGVTATMSRKEALQIFELVGQPTREQISERYKELMRNVHPDRGGSTYLAAKLNQARDVLLHKS